MTDAYILAGLRTPIGRRKGQYGETHPINLIAPLLRTLAEQVEAAAIEDVILGCVTPFNEQGANIARIAALHAGLPVTVPGVQINRMCGSSQQALHFAAQAIMAGDMDLLIAGGIEHMTRVPLGSDWPSEGFPGWPYEWVHQGISAERVAAKWGFSRKQLDDFSYESHCKAAAAIRAGYFEREVLAMGSAIDEGVRMEPDRARMAALGPAFQEDGVITAANSSQISDGAAALLIGSEAAVRRFGLKPRARIVSRVVVADDPEIMLTAPMPATRRALDRAGLRAEQIDLFEVSEAFAPVPLAWMEELGVAGEKVNVNGGGIALGHPVGASGARMMVTLLHELERRDLRYGLQTMCIGHGQGTATIIERV